MSRAKRISKLDRAVRLIMLCLFVSRTCPGLLLAQEDPLLEPPPIASAAADEAGELETLEFVDVDWAYEEEVVVIKPKNGDCCGGAGIICVIISIPPEWDRDKNGESRMVKATLQIPVAAVVNKEQESWRVRLRTQMPLFAIPNDMPKETDKALYSEIGYLWKNLIPDWGRNLTPEEVRLLLRNGKLSIELPDRFNKLGDHWERKGKILLPVRHDLRRAQKEPEEGPVTIRFVREFEGIFSQINDAVFSGEAFYLELLFKNEPADASAREVNLKTPVGLRAVSVAPVADEPAKFRSKAIVLDIVTDEK